MREPSNYPPGVSGNEPEITGEAGPKIVTVGREPEVERLVAVAKRFLVTTFERCSACGSYNGPAWSKHYDDCRFRELAAAIAAFHFVPAPEGKCDCQDYEGGLVSNECPEHG